MRKVIREASASLNLQDKSAEVFIFENARLVEELFSSRAWQEIAFPLILEMKASVSGRFTNGRFYQGDLTRTDSNKEKLSGYQLALEEFHNRLHDFIQARDNLRKQKIEESLESKAPVFNPFMEAEYE